MQGQVVLERFPTRANRRRVQHKRPVPTSSRVVHAGACRAASMPSGRPNRRNRHSAPSRYPARAFLLLRRQGGGRNFASARQCRLGALPRRPDRSGCAPTKRGLRRPVERRNLEVSSQASIIPLCTRLPLNGILVDVRVLYKTDGARLSTVRIIWWIPPDASGRGSAARLGRYISRPYSRTPSDCRRFLGVFSLPTC